MDRWGPGMLGDREQTYHAKMQGGGKGPYQSMKRVTLSWKWVVREARTEEGLTLSLPSTQLPHYSRNKYRRKTAGRYQVVRQAGPASWHGFFGAFPSGLWQDETIAAPSIFARKSWCLKEMDWNSLASWKETWLKGIVERRRKRV